MERKTMTCIQCGGMLIAKSENYRYTSSGLKNVTLLGVEVRRCGQCGDYEVVIPRIEELHRVLASSIVRRASRLASEEIRFLRKYLGYSGVDFAKLIGVSAETVSRWENAKEAMGPSAEKLLRMLVAYTQPIKRYPVETLAKISGDRTPKPIGLRAKGDGWVEEKLKAA